MPQKERSALASRAFRAILERSQSRLNWVIVRIPFDVAQVWGKRGSLRVKGEINEFTFTTSLFPTGDGKHVLLVNKKMQAGAKAGPGSTLGQSVGTHRRRCGQRWLLAPSHPSHLLASSGWKREVAWWLPP